MFEQSPVGKCFSSFLHNRPTLEITLTSFSRGVGKKLTYTHREAHNLTIKKSQSWIYPVRWMNLPCTLLSERSHLYDLLEQTQGQNESVAARGLGWREQWDSRRTIWGAMEQFLLMESGGRYSGLHTNQTQRTVCLRVNSTV